MTKTLDLGCGPQPKNPFNADDVYGVDVVGSDDNRIKVADLVIEPIPFDDNMFDYVTAYDLIEHIPRLLYCPKRRHPFIELISEVYRVLKVGGIFFSHTPAYPHPSAFFDPTHVNYITAETFPFYFCNPKARAKMYGFKGLFDLLKQEHNGPQMVTIMRKVDMA